MSPFEIEIAMHYYCRCGDSPDIKVPIGPQTIKEMVDQGLLTFDPSGAGQQYFPTEKLRVYCEALQAIPLPKRVWKL